MFFDRRIEKKNVFKRPMNDTQKKVIHDIRHEENLVDEEVLEKKPYVVEVRMPRRMMGKINKDRIRNDAILHMLGVVETSKKNQRRRLHWYGNVMRREESHVVIGMVDLK